MTITPPTQTITTKLLKNYPFGWIPDFWWILKLNLFFLKILRHLKITNFLPVNLIQLVGVSFWHLNCLMMSMRKQMPFKLECLSIAKMLYCNWSTWPLTCCFTIIVTLCCTLSICKWSSSCNSSILDWVSNNSTLSFSFVLVV